MLCWRLSGYALGKTLYLSSTNSPGNEEMGMAVHGGLEPNIQNGNFYPLKHPGAW